MSETSSPLDLGSTVRGFAVGQKAFNRYTLKKVLGRGGMGVVWLARDDELVRDVALKFLPEIVVMDRESVAELKRETRRNLDLTHANIVRIYDFVQSAQTAAISMEYVDGASLAALKADQPQGVFPMDVLQRWLEQLGEALSYAHERVQIVHRDIKPANLMVNSRGEVKVTDFGIATSLSDSVSRVSKQAGSSGTPVYMSPQQMMGERAAVTDDVYALGATLYEMLTGKPPFYTGNVLMQVTNKVPPAIAARRAELGVSNPETVSEAWEKTIAACLAKSPEQRPQSVREVVQGILARGGAGGMTAASPLRATTQAVTAAPKAETKPESRISTPIEGSAVRYGGTADSRATIAEPEYAVEAARRRNGKGVIFFAFAAVAFLGGIYFFGIRERAQHSRGAETAQPSPALRSQ